jgi:hypothetical protein
MPQPHKPIEAQGLGCGLMISIVAVTVALSWLGLSPGASMVVAMILAGISLAAYMVNQFKAQRILDHDYKMIADGRTGSPPYATGASDGDGEGMYCIVGVDKESGMDTTWHAHASSAANAKVKGELQGIVVTQVTKV